MLNRFCNSVLDRRKIANIGRDSKTFAAAIFYDLFHCLKILDLSARDGDLGTVLRKRPRDAARNARAAPSYKRNFTL